MPFGRPFAMRFPVLCLLCLAFAGCSYLSFMGKWWSKEEPPPPPEPYLPVPTQFPISSQFRLEAGRHWQSIAEDSARILVHGMRRHRCMPGKGCRPIYIAMPEVETWFSRIFMESMITALVSQNVEITKAPEAALILHIDVHSLKFGFGDKVRNEQKVRQIMPNLWASSTESREPTPVADQLFHARSAHSEIFVTLSVLDGERYITRNSQLYYVSAEDLRLYEQRICSRLNPCAGGRTEGQQPSPSAILPRTGTLKIVDEPNGRNDTKPGALKTANEPDGKGSVQNETKK